MLVCLMRKLEITVQDQGKWKSLCRVRETGDNCAGPGKLEITVQDQGKWKSLCRVRESGDNCAGPEELEITVQDQGNWRSLCRTSHTYKRNIQPDVQRYMVGRYGLD